MLEFLKFIDLGKVVTSFALLYVSSKTMKEKIDFRTFKFILFLLLMTEFLWLSAYIKIDLLRVVFNYISLVIVTWLMFKKDFVKVLVFSLLNTLIIAVAELIYVVGLISILNISMEEIKLNHSYSVLANIAITLVAIVIVNIKIIINYINRFVSNINLKISRTVIFLLSIAIVNFTFLFYQIYFDIPSIVLTIFNMSIIVIVSILVLLNLKEKSDNEKIQTEYSIVINNLSDYESMLEKQRMNNHENKNQLAVIKGMIGNKYNSKKINEYIDSIVSDKNIDDNDILYKTKKIPLGGLQGLFYQKLIKMKDRNIKYFLDISKAIKLESLNHIDIDTNKKICTIIGIYLDNAIEAAEQSDDKEISIQFYFEGDYIIVSIANTYNGIIELDKMDNKGYSSKGSGRGYGLSIAKQLIEQNKWLISEREILGNIFKQKIKIKV